jgi:hypothetical protein
MAHQTSECFIRNVNDVPDSKCWNSLLTIIRLSDVPISDKE